MDVGIPIFPLFYGDCHIVFFAGVRVGELRGGVD